MKDMREENDVTRQEESEEWFATEEYLKRTEICDDIEEETEWER